MNPTPPDFHPGDYERRQQKKRSFRFVTEAFFNSVERFPVTLCYLAAFVIWGVTDCWCYDWFDDAPATLQNLRPALWFLTGNGILLTLAVTLWCEQYGQKTKRRAALIFANLLLLADFIYILFCLKNFSDSEQVGRLAIDTALIVSILFIPKFDKKSQKYNLLFSFNQFGNAIKAGIISAVLAIATGIIYGTISLLFGNIDFKFYLSTLLIFSGGLSMLIFIGSVPTLSETIMSSTTQRPIKFVVGLIKFILLPLTLIYTLILYIYGFKILAAGSMPKGEICLMVTALTAAVYLLLFLLKSIENEKDRLIQAAMRDLPLVILPLLVMMSVAIFERIDQYGMTVARLYVVTFNICAYATAIYLFVTRSRNTNIVALSFAIVFLLTSILPGLNYTSLVQDYMRSAVFSNLESAGVDKAQYPLSHNDYEKTINRMDSIQAADVRSKLIYLDDPEDHSLTEDIVDFKIKSSSYGRLDPLFEEPRQERIVRHTTLSLSDDDVCTIPSGYTTTRYLSSYHGTPKLNDDKTLTVDIEGSSITLDIDSIIKLNPDSPQHPITIELNRADSLLVITTLNFTVDKNTFDKDGYIDQLTVKGYLFTK